MSNSGHAALFLSNHFVNLLTAIHTVLLKNNDQPHDGNSMIDVNNEAAFQLRQPVVKPGTMDCYRACRKLFESEFSPEESIEAVTPDRLLGWKTSLLFEYEAAGVASQLKIVNTLFNWAVDQELLTKNPMKKVPRGSFINRDKDRIITMEEYAKLLDACPTPPSYNTPCG